MNHWVLSRAFCFVELWLIFLFHWTLVGSNKCLVQGLYPTTYIREGVQPNQALSGSSGFTKLYTVSWSWLSGLCYMYLPDDDNVEVQLITLLDNVGDVRGPVLSDALTLAGWGPGWCHIHSLGLWGPTATEEEISTGCGGTDDLHGDSSKRWGESKSE